MDAQTGRVLWKFKNDQTFIMQGSPAVSNGVVYFTSTERDSNKSYLHKKPAISDGIVIYGGQRGGGYYALDAQTGQQKLRFTLCQ